MDEDERLTAGENLLIHGRTKNIKKVDRFKNV